MIDSLRNNLQTEIKIVKEIAFFINKLDATKDSDKKIVQAMINSGKSRIKILNDSAGELIKGLSLAKNLPSQETNGKKGKIENVKVNVLTPDSPVRMQEEFSEPVNVGLRIGDKSRFLDELNISEELLKKLKKKKIVSGDKIREYKKPQGYAKLANLLFREFSENLLERGNFENLRVNLRKSNMNILPTTYISMMFLGVCIAAVVGFFISIFMIMFQLSFTYPFIGIFQGNFLIRILQMSWITLAIPLITGAIFYFYPYTERQSLGVRIDSELPFVVIHMASISGSGIEPTQIFRIIGLNKEYKSSGGEIKKLLNQINIYGYDLVTALKIVADSTPSKRLAELLKGLGTSIRTGGDLKSFLEKRAETLLLAYRVEREKFIKTAETFMDIYISVVIAAPMILLLLLIMISVSGIGFGLSTGSMTLLIIFAVGAVNVLFLVLLSAKQPRY